MFVSLGLCCNDQLTSGYVDLSAVFFSGGSQSWRNWLWLNYPGLHTYILIYRKIQCEYIENQKSIVLFYRFPFSGKFEIRTGYNDL